MENPLVPHKASTIDQDRHGPIIDALTASGAKAELIDLKQRGILGNSHFAMFESNRKQVFEVIRGWIEKAVPPATSTARA